MSRIYWEKEILSKFDLTGNKKEFFRLADNLDRIQMAKSMFLDRNADFDKKTAMDFLKHKISSLRGNEFLEFTKEENYNFLEINDKYSILLDEDVEKNINKQDWQLSLEYGGRDDDMIALANVYDDNGAHLIMEFNLFGENRISINGKTVENIDDYNEVLLKIAESYFRHTHHEDIVDFVYDENTAGMEIRLMGLYSREQVLDNISSDSGEMAEKLFLLLQKKLESFNTLELEGFAKEHYDKNFEIKNDMGSSVHVDLFDVFRNPVVNDESSYSNMKNALEGVKKLVTEVFENNASLYLSNTKESNSLNIVCIENKTHQEEMPTGNALYELAKVKNGYYDFNLENLAAYGNGYLDMDDDFEIEFGQRKIYISKDEEGVSVEIFDLFSGVPIDELGSLTYDDLSEPELLAISENVVKKNSLTAIVGEFAGADKAAVEACLNELSENKSTHKDFV
ncbi:MAG: hypothetical protein A3F91_09560 [Flavobacteria bacterium RIFCSPLOWO2_12_FULL_35_11]|nr:MAG: hypothetical protein A3F91_09560 [Flavobacteria bacterium RIFCSPLOWO2_12_FULL_35_11]